MSAKRPFSFQHWLLPIIILLVAAFFRFHALATIPPSLFHDEAVNGLDALTVIRTRQIPIFFSANNGREPLLIYLQAVAFALFGNREISLRLVSAYAGVITVAITGGLVKDLFAKRPFRTHVSLLAMLILALSFWHIHFSRIAFRAIIMLPLITAALWFFWRGWQRGRWRDYAIAGMMLGLSLYTYIPARLTPLILGGSLLIDAFQQRRKKEARFLPQKSLVLGTLLLFIIAGIIFTPLGIHYLTHQDNFDERSQQVSIFTASEETGQSLPVVFVRHLWEMGRMFVDRGHHYPALNLPYRPVLEWLTLAGFVLGILLTLTRWRQAVYPFLLLWFSALLLPAILSNEADHPLRALGAVVPMAILIALGLNMIGEQITKKRQPFPLFWPLYLLLIGVVVGTSSYRDYFINWGHRADTIQTFSTAHTKIGQRLLTLADVAVLPAEVFEHPTTQFVLQSALENIQQDETLTPPETAVSLYPSHFCRPQTEMVLWQQKGQTASFRYLPPSQLNTKSWLQNENLTALTDSRQRTIAWETPLHNFWGKTAVLPTPISANFNHEWCLLGFDVQPAAAHTPESDLELILYWEKLSQDSPDYRAEIRLENTAGDWPMTVTLPQLTQPAQHGKIVAQTYPLTLPQAAQLPGKFRFRINLLDAQAAEIPLMNRLGLPYAPPALTAYVALGEKAIIANEIQQPQDFTVGDPPLMHLIGIEADWAAFQPGDSATITLYWQSLLPAAKNYAVFVHLLDHNGAMISQHDSEPGNGRFPTGTWLPPEIIKDRHTLTLPAAAPPGPYTVAIGVYDWQTGERLPTATAAGDLLPNGQVLLDEE